MSKTPNIYLRLLLFILTLLWFLGALLPFYVEFFPPLTYLLPFTHMLYSTVCHQLASKLICAGGACSLVCSRCIGIYAGFAVSALVILIANPVKFKSIILLVYAAIPMMLDVVFSSIGAYNYSPWTASFTGFVFGCAAFYYFYKGLFQIIIVRLSRSHNEEQKELD